MGSLDADVHQHATAGLSDGSGGSRRSGLRMSETPSSASLARSCAAQARCAAHLAAMYLVPTDG